MKQTTLDINLSLKKTRKREFLEQREQVVPWAVEKGDATIYYPSCLPF